MLLLIGLAIAAMGLVWILLPQVPWLGRLMGDIYIEKPNFRLYVPVATCFLLSVALSLVWWLIRWLRGS
jgi:hypothetical protein